MDVSRGHSACIALHSDRSYRTKEIVKRIVFRLARTDVLADSHDFSKDVVCV